MIHVKHTCVIDSLRGGRTVEVYAEDPSSITQLSRAYANKADILVMARGTTSRAVVEVLDRSVIPCGYAFKIKQSPRGPCK